MYFCIGDFNRLPKMQNKICRTPTLASKFHLLENIIMAVTQSLRSPQPVNSLQGWCQALRHMGLPALLSWLFDSRAGKLVNFDIYMTLVKMTRKKEQTQSLLQHKLWWRRLSKVLFSVLINIRPGSVRLLTGLYSFLFLIRQVRTHNWEQRL